MTRQLPDGFYRGLGLFSMVLTLLSALWTVFDPMMWWCVAFGYAVTLAMARMQHDWRRREATMAGWARHRSSVTHPTEPAVIPVGEE